MTTIINIPLRKRKGVKLTKNQRELQSDWNELMNKWGNKKLETKYEPYRGDTSYDDRGNKAIPSRGSGVGNAPLKDVPVYSGNKMVGICIQHKSCLQPVFSQQEAKDSAGMRR